jgi:purine-binding chemotaxis protein CheW
MNETMQLLAFSVGDYRYALPLSAVKRIVRAVEVTPLPDAPDTILGLINIQGQIIPVVSVRRRLGLPEREVSLTDRLIIGHSSKGTVALLVDAVSGVIEPEGQEVITAEKILPGAGCAGEVARLAEEIVLVQDLDAFFSFGEEEAFSGAAEQAT